MRVLRKRVCEEVGVVGSVHTPFNESHKKKGNECSGFLVRDYVASAKDPPAKTR